MMITSIKCQSCGRIFVYTFHTRKCVCGWEPSQDAQKGIENVGKRNKRKNRKAKEMTTKAASVPVTYGGASSRNDTWEVKIDEVHNCDKVPKEQKVLIEVFAKRKITALMKKYPSIEWLAYLLGDKENDPYVVKDIFIPEQTVTATSVDNISCDQFNDLPIIGVIHSHHGMGNGFSGTDHEWINQNHNISLCISNTGIAGQVRLKTPCGAVKIIPAIIKVKYPESDFKFDEWVEEESKKINKKTYTPPVYTGGNGYWDKSWGGNSYKNGVRGRWINGVFFPDDEDDVSSPSQKGGQSKPLSESQKSYTNGVAVVPPKKDDKEVVEEIDAPTIDEEMSLADALTMLDVSDTTTEVIEPTSVEVEEAKDNVWNTD